MNQNIFCPNCPDSELYKTLDNRHVVCPRCEYLVDLEMGKISNVVLDNKMKHFSDVIKKFFITHLPDSVVDRAKVYLNEKISIANYGNGNRNIGKWRKRTLERYQTARTKWAREFLNIERLRDCKSAEYELVRKLYSKPMLTRSQITKVTHLFKQYILYLHSMNMKLSVNYDLFLHNAFQVLEIDPTFYVLYPLCCDKERKSYLMNLWNNFLCSPFFTEYFVYKEPPPNYYSQFFNEYSSLKQSTYKPYNGVESPPNPLYNGKKPSKPEDWTLILATPDRYCEPKVYCCFS